MPEFKPILTTAGINGFNGYRLDGEHPDDYTGRSTSGAGDVNGDGYADLLLVTRFVHVEG